MPIIKEESSKKWRIVFVDCIEPGGVFAVMTRFEVTSPDGKTRSVRPAFTMEFVEDYFRIPGDKNIDKNRAKIIKEKESLFRLWGLVKIEELLDGGSLEAEPKISSQSFKWAEQVERGILKPSSVRQDENAYSYTSSQRVSMLFNAKRPSELSPNDVKSIIGREENQEIDFKQVAYRDTGKSANEWKLDLLKDVTSLANSHGGYLFIGVGEDANGRAVNFRNIENAQEKSRSIFDICYQHIEEKLTGEGIVVEPYTVDKSTEIIIIRILPGQNQPYMISFNKNTLFYKRHGKSNRTMTISEIRDIFKGDEQLRRLEKIEKMLEHLTR